MRNVVEKFKKRRYLKLTEKLLLLNYKFRRKHKILLGDVAHKGRKELTQRIIDMMRTSNLIIILLKNYGGVAVEHGMCMDKKLISKTVNLIDIKDRKKLSNFITKGTLHWQDNYYYDNDKDLIDRVGRVVSKYLLKDRLPHSITIDLKKQLGINYY